MQEYSIPRWQTPVELTLVDGARRTVDVFLMERVGESARPERVSERFDGMEEFVPILDPSTGKVGLVGRAGIVSIRTATQFEPIDPVAYPLREGVRITTVEGATLIGSLVWSGPPGHTRLQDALNGPGRFIRVLEGDAVLLVNKAHVLSVDPSEPGSQAV
jgi:hypothetical protein